MSYLFYALESSGGSFAFDQVLRFAGIRTDEQFREQDRYLVRTRLRPDVVPSPRTLIEDDLALSELGEGDSELEAVRRIHELVNEPGTVSAGYGSLRFDDEFLRFSFFRNLLSPYTHQWDNNCGRMDLLPVTACYWLSESDALSWPGPEEQDPLALAELDRANDLGGHRGGGEGGGSHGGDADGGTDPAGGGDAPGAIGRVRALVSLARRLAGEETWWADLRDQFDKNIDRDRLGTMPTVRVGEADYPVALMVGGEFGPDRSYQCPALCLGRHRHYRNRTVWLRLDRAQLRGASEESVVRHTDTVSRKFGVPPFLLTPEDGRISRVDEKQRAVARRNLRWLQGHPEVFHQIAGFYLEQTYRDAPSVDVDAALYRFGFMSDRDRRVADRFHAQTDPEAMLETAERFDAPELRELAVRVIMRNAPPDRWPDRVRSYARWYWGRIRPQHHADVLRDHRGVRRRTPQQARKELRALRADAHREEAGRIRLEALESYLADGIEPVDDLQRSTRTS